MLRTTATRALGPLAAGVLLVATLVPEPARGADALNYFKNYLVTGDYLAVGVGLQHTGLNGFATGMLTVPAAQIPAGAEVVAAYLYWQTISSSGAPDPSVLQGAKFDGNDLGTIAVLLTKAGTAPCWSGGGATGGSNGSKATWSYRADVLRFFPRVRPASPNQPVQVQVAGNHTVRLPDMGGSNQLPSTLGAGLVIVYRVIGYDPTTGYQMPRMPLRAVILYDGGFTMNNQTQQMQVTLQGFYEASRNSPNARMTHLVADGQANKTERVQITSTASAGDNRVVAINPFGGNTGFDAVTFQNVPLEPGAMKATVTVDPGTTGSFDCLSWNSVVMSMAVQDRDGDGLLDVQEARSEWSSKPTRLASVYPSWPLTDPTGAALPDLGAMGANPSVQDVFVQIDYLTGADGHSHLPLKSALQSVATALRNAPPRPSMVAAGLCASGAPAGQCPIAVHFDVGGNYQPTAGFSASSCASASTWTPDCAIVPAAQARGGNPIPETPCSASGFTPAGASCAFPSFAGVVGWKNGLRAYRDAPVNRANGSVPCSAGQAGCAPRMPRTLKDIAHYALFAHALGYGSLENPLVPRKTSGIADAAGGDFMVTLGLWDQQTGSAFMQGSTLLHELGHNLGLRHGGVVPSGALEPNCKPNYLSVMNYLFQVRGLLDTRGVPNIESLAAGAAHPDRDLARRVHRARSGHSVPPAVVRPVQRELHRHRARHLPGHSPLRRLAAGPRRSTVRPDRRRPEAPARGGLERRRAHRRRGGRGRQLRRGTRRVVHRLERLLHPRPPTGRRSPCGGQRGAELQRHRPHDRRRPGPARAGGRRRPLARHRLRRPGIRRPGLRGPRVRGPGIRRPGIWRPRVRGPGLRGPRVRGPGRARGRAARTG